MVTVATGVITTVAGNGLCAFSGDGGPASSAALCEPAYLFVDVLGDIYIADTAIAIVRNVDVPWRVHMEVRWVAKGS